MIKNQRRVFRGRGGPTDRRLPKHNARRRRPPPQSNTRAPNDDATSAEHESSSNFPANACNPVACHTTPSAHFSEQESVTSNHIDRVRVTAPDDRGYGSYGYDANFGPETTSKALSPCEAPLDYRDSDTTDHGKLQAEIEHVRLRIMNIQQTMRNSGAIAIPSNYQTLVLDAVRNVTRTWKSILSFYSNSNHADQDTLSAQKLSVGTLIFQVIQQSLQCGPLSGSKAGYMKRCGSDVANQVAAFLEAVCTSPHDAAALGMTEKQIQAVFTWKKNSIVATEFGKEKSSQSVLKIQKRAQRKVKMGDN